MENKLAQEHNLNEYQTKNNNLQNKQKKIQQLAQHSHLVQYLARQWWKTC